MSKLNTAKSALLAPIVEPSMSTRGGDLKDRPPQWRWFADALSTRKRRLEVRVMKYYGVGQHFHVRVTEEDDSFYVPDYEGEGPALWTPRDLPEDMRGRVHYEKFNTPEAASRFVAETLQRMGITAASH